MCFAIFTTISAAQLQARETLHDLLLATFKRPNGTS